MAHIKQVLHLSNHDCQTLKSGFVDCCPNLAWVTSREVPALCVKTTCAELIEVWQ